MLELDILLSPVFIDVQRKKFDKYVVIDLFRATTAFCTAFNYGIKEIIPFADSNEARKMSKKGFLIAGERDGDKLEGFDYGNSPFGFMTKDIDGKSLAFTTTNGTKAIEKVKNKGEVIIASLNNLSFVVNYLKEQKKNVCLVCSGWKNMPNIEDSLCAGAIAEKLIDAGFSPQEDSVFMCVDLYKKAKGNLLNYIVQNSARVADRMNVLGRDFEKCLEIDIYNVLPVLKGDKIVNII